MKNIICLILILSTEISSAQFTSEQQQQQREAQNIVIGTMVTIVAVSAIIIAVVSSKAHKQAMTDEAKFQACIAKTKSEIYTLYGPPNSIVDDGQGQGGTILEYLFRGRSRKMFYLNKDNVVTAVKEDNH